MQLRDLRSAVRWLLTAHEGIAVMLYFAYIDQGRIAFQSIEA